MVLAQCLQHLLHGTPRVYDILHNNDGASADVCVQPDKFLHLPGRGDTIIRCQLHKRHLAGDGHFTQQVGRKHEGSVQHTQKERILIRHVMADAYAQFLYTLFDFCLSNSRSKCFILDFYDAHWMMKNKICGKITKFSAKNRY